MRHRFLPTIIAGLLISSFSYAEYQVPQDETSAQKQDGVIYPQYTPSSDTTIPSQDPSINNTNSIGEEEVDETIIKAKDYLKFYKKRKNIPKIINQDRVIKEYFLELPNLKVANFNKKFKMRDINQINMHPNYPQTIILPTSATVTNVYTYPPTVQPNAQFNRIDIVPSNDLLKTTMIVTYLEGNSIKNTTFLISKVSNNRHSLIYPIITYAYPTLLDSQRIVSIYYDSYGKMPRNKSTINIGGNIYTFVKDNINGYVKIGNDNYIVRANND